MKKIILYLLIVLSLSGCVSSVPRPESTGGVDSGVRLGTRMLEAIRGTDYAAFSALADGGGSDRMSAKDFEALCSGLTRQFGVMEGFEFLTALRTPTVKNLVWKVGFKRKNFEGKTIVQEILFRLVTGDSDGKPTVLGFGFI